MSQTSSNQELIKKCGMVFGFIALIVFLAAAMQEESLEKDALVEYEYYQEEGVSVEEDGVEEQAVEEIAAESEEDVNAAEEELYELTYGIDQEEAEMVEEVEAVEEVAEVVEEAVEKIEEIEESFMEENIEEAAAKIIEEDIGAIMDRVIESNVDNSLAYSDSTTDTRMCKLPQLGVQFVCNPDWPVVPSEEGADRVLISNDPYITMGIEKVDKKFRFLSQLSTVYFEKTGLFKEGFRIEKVEFAGHDAVMVKALSAYKESTQRRDYFYIFNGTTVHISFMLPNTEWTPEDRENLQQITKSFQNYTVY